MRDEESISRRRGARGGRNQIEVVLRIVELGLSWNGICLVDPPAAIRRVEENVSRRRGDRREKMHSAICSVARSMSASAETAFFAFLLTFLMRSL